MGTKDLHSINTSFNSNPGIVHVAADVSKDLEELAPRFTNTTPINSTHLSLQAKLADSLAVQSRLLRGTGTRKFDLETFVSHRLQP